MTQPTGSDLPTFVANARHPSASLVRSALSGLLAASFALAIGQALAGLVGPISAPIIAVGEAAIDLTPEFLKSFAIQTFGSNDKLALVSGIVVILAGAAILIGIAAGRRIQLGWLGIGLFGVVGLAAVATRPNASAIDALPTIVGVIAGGIALSVLIRSARPEGPRPERATREPSTTEAAEPGRRHFLAAAGAVGGLTLLTGGLGLLGLRTPPSSGLKVPVPSDQAPLTPPAAMADVPGISPFITPNNRFYRVDTAIIPPAVDPATWRLRVHGMVERELNLDLATLLGRPTIERDITLTCVSNEVGGPYVGTARWIGIPLRPLLEEAGIQAGADQIISRSVDGFTAGTPTAIAMDGRDAMLAVAMNGQALAAEHGFPVRLLVPGLYGYVSATKWLTDLELTTFASSSSYWVQRGWQPQGPIKTMTRIDAPAALTTVNAGPVAIGGVAWAQHRGIKKVELQIDNGPWAAANLAEVDTIDTWRQWSYPWTATSGRHSITVRATDGSGTTQPEERLEPFPDGATGWHSLVVLVS